MEDPRYSVSEDGTLRIAPMSDTDLGVYECMAKSPTGEVKSRSAKMIYNKQNCESLISYLLCSQEKPKFWFYYFTWDNFYYIYWKFTGKQKRNQFLLWKLQITIFKICKLNFEFSIFSFEMYYQHFCMFVCIFCILPTRFLCFLLGITAILIIYV